MWGEFFNRAIPRAGVDCYPGEDGEEKVRGGAGGGVWEVENCSANVSFGCVGA